MEPVLLEDPMTGIELKAPTEADIPAITAACQDPVIADFTTVPSPYTEADARTFVTEVVPASWSKGGAEWGIYRERGQLAGMIGLAARGDATVELGYWVAPDSRGQGTLHPAIRLALDFAFDELGAEKVSWSAVVGNWGSWRAAWKHGFRREGISRLAHRSLNEGEPARTMWTASLLKQWPREPAEPWTGPDGVLPAIPNPRDPEALVRQFHETYHLPVVTGEPSVDIDRIDMRMGLIAEEFAELVGAVYGAEGEERITVAFREVLANDANTRDTVAAADALADLIYVIYGMALESGIALDAVLREVQRSNLSKLGADGAPIYREDGKVLKGPGFFEPRIAEALTATRLRESLDDE
ncbi:MAG: GNAT family N-acetyltransferase [Ruaniaceae bacterium]|nr:GNAT family N-acetyltransferase [Ruaniaceae bacterium]